MNASREYICKCEYSSTVYVHINIILTHVQNSIREIITSRFAPEYIPNIPPSVEYLAEDVPVPIPKTSNNKYSSTNIYYIITILL